jgi:transposase
MAPKKTSRTQFDLSSKNQFVGAMQATGDLTKSANLVGMNTSTASRLWKKFQKTGTCKNLPRSGRPAKLKDRAKRAMVRDTLKNRRKPFQEIGHRAAENVSESTVRRVLDEQGFHRRVARKVPFLTQAQKHKRLRWAQEFADIDEKEWINLMPSDECMIEIDDGKGRVYITRRPREEYNENCVVPKMKQSNIKSMVWASVMLGKKGPIVALEYPGGKGGGMNKERYISQVLDAHVKPFYDQVEKERPGVVFQQDGAPSHTAKLTKKWFTDNEVVLFPHPPNSPDLNPIEPVWHELKKIIRARPHLPSSTAQLISAIHEAWDQLPQEDIDKHIRTMPERVQAVLKAKGGHTRF